MDTKVKRIIACVNGPHCSGLHSQEVVDALKNEIHSRSADRKFEIIAGGCVGMCGNGPNLRLSTGGRRCIAYCHLKPSDAAELVEAHIGEDCPVERLILKRQ